jgi:hypothetical protein
MTEPKWMREVDEQMKRELWTVKPGTVSRLIHGGLSAGGTTLLAWLFGGIEAVKTAWMAIGVLAVVIITAVSFLFAVMGDGHE